MERGPQPGNPEADAENRKPIEGLPEKLGFKETEELTALKGVLVEAIRSDSEEVAELARRYQALGGEVVDELEGVERTRAQIGLIVQVGLIRREGGRVNQYMQDLEDAIDYAWGVGLDEEVTVLEAALAEARTDTA